MLYINKKNNNRLYSKSLLKSRNDLVSIVKFIFKYICDDFGTCQRIWL